MATRTSSQTGDWSATSTWGGSAAPGNGDTAVITVGHTVSIYAHVTVGTSGVEGVDAITVNGSLSVGDDITLTVRGDITVADLKTVTLSPGATLKFDSSVAASPSTTSYKLRLGTTHYHAAGLICAGVSYNRCTVTSETANSAKQGQCGNPTYYSGYIQAAYTDFSRLGIAATAAGSAFGQLFPNYPPANTSFDHCTFDICYRLWTFNMVSGVGVRIDDCVWTNTLDVYCCTITGSSATPDEYLLRDTRFDKTVELWTAAGATIVRCYFGADCSTQPGSAWSSFTDNFCRSTTANTYYAAIGDISNCIFYADLVDTNPHFLSTGRSTGSITVDGCIFEYVGNNGDGDCIITGGSGADATTTVQNCIVLPNWDRVYGAGELASLTDYDTDFIYFYHNTCYDYGVQIAYPSHIGQVAAFKSNLIYHDTPGEGLYKINDLPSTVQDVIASGDADYNAGFNLTAGSNLKGYHNLNLSSGSPGAHDVDGEDPGLVDDTRNVATYDIAGLGSAAGTVWEDSTAYVVGNVVSAATSGFYGNVSINYRCIAAHTSDSESATLGKPGSATSWRTSWEFQSLYRLREDTARIPLMMDWIKAGMAPRNEVYRNAGHDSVTIGASEMGVVGIACSPTVGVHHFD